MMFFRRTFLRFHICTLFKKKLQIKKKNINYNFLEVCEEKLKEKVKKISICKNYMSNLRDTFFPYEVNDNSQSVAQRMI